MNAIVATLNSGSIVELDGREIEEVSGGFLAALGIALVAVGAAATALYGVEQLGEKIGEAAYDASH